MSKQLKLMPIVVSISSLMSSNFNTQFAAGRTASSTIPEITDKSNSLFENFETTESRRQIANKVDYFVNILLIPKASGS